MSRFLHVVALSSALLWAGCGGDEEWSPREWEPYDSSTPATRLVPAGPFLMGPPPHFEHMTRENGLPSHMVTISRDMVVMTTEVTQRDFEELMEFNPSQDGECGPDCAVSLVTFSSAAIYANLLSERDGLDACYTVERCSTSTRTGNWRCSDVIWDRACKGWRLPTEAEWEYLAEGGTGASWSCGDSIECGRWLSWQYSLRWRQGYRSGGPVGFGPSNGYGIYDVCGGVYEMVWSASDFYSAEPVTDPVFEPRSGSLGIRGGSFMHSNAANISTFGRSGIPLDAARGDIGFRLVRNVDEVDGEAD